MRSTRGRGGMFPTGTSKRSVGSGFSRSKVGVAKPASKVTKGKNRPATGSRLRTARPKRGAAGGRGY